MDRTKFSSKFLGKVLILGDSYHDSRVTAMELGDELIVRKPREGYKKKDERDEIRLFGINDLDAKSDQEAFRASLDAIRASVEDLTIPSLDRKSVV